MPRGGGRATIEDVMGKFKRSSLHSGAETGPLVQRRDQAIAIALNEAGLERRKEPPTKRRKRPVFGT